MLPISDLGDVELVQTRVSILYDSTYHVVISAMIEEISELMIDTPFTVSLDSYIDNNPALLHTFSQEDMPSSEIIKRLEEDPTSFVFKNGKLYTRPYFTIEPQNPSQSHRTMKDGTSAFRINEEILMVVKYQDPDNIEFNEIFEEVKMKDRGEFIETPSLFKLSPETQEFKFSITSAFPGIAVLRAKDTMYLCTFVPYRMRFTQ